MVDIAQDGEEALVRVLNEDYDFVIVILDLMLPGPSGEEILRTMRSRSMSTPVIALTAKDAVADKVRLLDQTSSKNGATVDRPTLDSMKFLSTLEAEFPCGTRTGPLSSRS